MPFPLIPVAVGAGALVVTGLGLRIRAVALKKKPVVSSAPVQATLPSGKVVTAPPVTAVTTVAQAAAAAQGKPIPPAAPNAPTMSDLAAALANPTANKISFDGITVEELNAAKDLMDAQNVAKVSEAIGNKAIVTTNDPAPAGDLIVRSGPSMGSPQIGGAEKNGIVTVLDTSDTVFARISWSGGPRWPAVDGFAKKAFLKLV